MKIIQRIIKKNKKAWGSKQKLALWEDTVTVKKAIGYAPFDLVCGIAAKLPQNNFMKIYNFIQEYDGDM